MDPLSFYNALQDYLVLNSRLVGVLGQHVNIGETFTMRFTLTVNAPTIGIDTPVIRYDNLGYILTCSDLARVPLGNGNTAQSITSNIEPSSLQNGQSASFDVELLAVASRPTPATELKQIMPGLHPLILGNDLIATAVVVGNVNVSEFFNIRRRWQVFQDIEPT